MTSQTFEQLLNEQRDGWTLARPFYREPAIFDCEIEYLFSHEWLFVGHTGRIPNPGDYFTYTIGREQLIIIRAQDGGVNAVWNVCRHRGSLICLEPCGSVKKLVCPYHQWVYDTDGSLLAARQMPDDFDKTEFGLDKARTHVFEGFIFINLSPDAPDFVPPHEAPMFPVHDFAGAKICHREEYSVRANWKVVLENFVECYHCGTVHPEYSQAMAGASGSFLSAKESEGQAGCTFSERKATVAELGLNPHLHYFLLRPGFVTQSMDGKPVAPLMGTYPAYSGMTWCSWLGWTMEMEACPDYAAVFRFTPISATHTNVEGTWLVRGDAVEGVDYETGRVTAFWKRTGQQDWDICERVQQGIESTRYVPGRLSLSEAGVHNFLAEYRRRMAVTIATHQENEP